MKIENYNRQMEENNWEADLQQSPYDLRFQNEVESLFEWMR